MWRWQSPLMTLRSVFNQCSINGMNSSNPQAIDGGLAIGKGDREMELVNGAVPV